MDEDQHSICGGILHSGDSYLALFTHTYSVSTAHPSCVWQGVLFYLKVVFAGIFPDHKILHDRKYSN